MISKIIKQQLVKLPNRPGVYRYYDKTGQLLYIGKATSLKRRVSSYFQRPQEPRIAELVVRIHKIEYTETNSVLEALFLESYLISSNKPPFNVRSKDDKTFANIIVTKEPFPRIFVARPTQKINYQIAKQYGPYTSAYIARQALELVRRIFPFRTNCKDGQYPNRGCLDYQLGLCPGPCANKISKPEYKKILSRIKLMLEGKTNTLIKNITKDMQTAAKNNDFESAAKLRNQLFALQHIRDVALIRRENDDIDNQDNSKVPARIEAYDISNTLSTNAVGSLIVLTNGKLDNTQYRKFMIKTVKGQNDLLMMDEVLSRRFRHLDWPMPNLVIIDGGEQHLKIAERVLKKAKLEIPVLAVAKGPERKKLDIYSSNPLFKHPNTELMRAIHLAREEAHRFAITYHRHKRDRGFLEQL